ncbi:F0F1 ATP synthase subunit epsilon [Mesoplasma photuris]|uniref:F0F1 ATP synthase subunit epsilon n=1 Tax=Mesoplasma photuris TaxID=217731 RepID=UPI0004E1628E|nr:F0F1 ATP synthase subunit epsilon [Mesoplasma photuris]
MGIKLKIVTPDGIYLDSTEVDIINIQSIDGDMGILENMIPMVTTLKIGTLTYKIKGEPKYVHVHRGLLTVDGKNCKVITERARPEDMTKK